MPGRSPAPKKPNPDVFFPNLYPKRTSSCNLGGGKTKYGGSGCSEAWLSRLLWEQKTIGSNPIIPTNCTLMAISEIRIASFLSMVFLVIISEKFQKKGCIPSLSLDFPFCSDFEMVCGDAKIHLGKGPAFIGDFRFPVMVFDVELLLVDRGWGQRGGYHPIPEPIRGRRGKVADFFLMVCFYAVFPGLPDSPKR